MSESIYCACVRWDLFLWNPYYVLIALTSGDKFFYPLRSRPNPLILSSYPLWFGTRFPKDDYVLHMKDVNVLALFLCVFVCDCGKTVIANDLTISLMNSLLLYDLITLRFLFLIPASSPIHYPSFPLKSFSARKAYSWFCFFFDLRSRLNLDGECGVKSIDMF